MSDKSSGRRRKSPRDGPKPEEDKKEAYQSKGSRADARKATNESLPNTATTKVN